MPWGEFQEGVSRGLESVLSVKLKLRYLGPIGTLDSRSRGYSLQWKCPIGVN